MVKSNFGRKALVISVTTAFLFVAVCVMFSGNVTAWDAEVSSGPTRVTEGGTVTFGVKVTNTGSESMEITAVSVHFDWMDEGYYYFSSDVSQDNPYVLGSGDSATFYIYGIAIPEGITTHTYHSYELAINAADPGIIYEWETPYNQEYSSSVFVMAPSSNNGGNGGSSGGGDSGGSSGYIDFGMVVLLLVMLGVVRIVAAVVIYVVRSKRNTTFPPPLPIQHTILTSHSPESNVNRPRYCPHCGREVPLGAVFCPYCGYNLKGGETK